MQTPEKVTLEGFLEARVAFMRGVEARPDPRLTFRCRKCGATIKTVSAQISVHEARFGGCAGWGEVINAAIPYCPSCEELPAATGCVHA